MQSPTANSRAPESTDGSDNVPSIVGLIADWLAASRDRAGTVTELAAAEARLAFTSLVLIVALGVVIALMIVSTWGLGAGGLVLFLNRSGVPVWVSLIGVALMHATIALLLYGRIKRLGCNLRFDETRRQVFATRAGDADDSV